MKFVVVDLWLAMPKSQTINPNTLTSYFQEDILTVIQFITKT